MPSLSSNRTLVLNSLILYLRLGIVCVFSLLSTRFAFNALGVSDFGLFSIVGSVISFIAIINTMMISSSNRFMAAAAGRGDEEGANRQFNTNLLIHVAIAVLTAVIAFPLGDWYVLNHINYDGDINTALKVYNLTMAASIFSFIGVPYNGLLLAKEKFIVFCSTDVLSSSIKLLVSWLMISHFEDKIQVYAWMMALTTAYPTAVFFLYCKKRFPSVTRFRLVRDIRCYKEVLSFTTWIGYGTLAFVGRTQFAAMLVNAFFNTVMNTALGISNSLKNLVETFASNITKPIEPQIVKSYAAGDYNRCANLLSTAVKFAFMMTLILLTPFFIETEFIIRLWLGDVPEYSVTLTRLSLLVCLADSLSSGISDYVFATGKIKVYQLCISTILLLSVPEAYFILRMGAPAWTLLLVYLAFSLVAFLARQIIIHRTLGFDNRILFRKSYLPSAMVFICACPALLLPMIGSLHPIAVILASTLYVSLCVLFLGLTEKERHTIIGILTSRNNQL